MEFFIVLILLAVISLLLLVILSGIFFAIDVFLDLPFVATKKEKIATIIKLANIKNAETVVDLGSGDGRLLIASAQKGARAIGYEINPFLILLTRIKTKVLGYSSSPFPNVILRNKATKDLDSSPPEADQNDKKGIVVIKHQNLWKANLKEADVIFVYGRQKTMQKFEDFVYKNAKRGTRVIVNTNPFPTEKPIKSKNGVFLYRA